jgi:hypothetical protein
MSPPSDTCTPLSWTWYVIKRAFPAHLHVSIQMSKRLVKKQTLSPSLAHHCVPVVDGKVHGIDCATL